MAAEFFCACAFGYDCSLHPTEDDYLLDVAWSERREDHASRADVEFFTSQPRSAVFPGSSCRVATDDMGGASGYPGRPSLIFDREDAR